MLKQMSIATNRDIDVTILEEGTDDQDTDAMENNYKKGFLRSLEEVSSDSELSEGGIKIQKEIDKMTGFNLQIKSLPVDLDSMQRLNLTPKNGVRKELNTKPYISALKDRGFLLFETEASQRKTQKQINKFKNQEFD